MSHALAWGEDSHLVRYDPIHNSFRMTFPAIEFSHFHWISKKNMLLLIKTYHFTNHRRRHIYLAHSEIESFIQNELRLGLGWKKQSLFCSSIHKYYVDTTHQITGLSFDRLIRQIITIFDDTSNSKRSHYPYAFSAPRWHAMPCQLILSFPSFQSRYFWILMMLFRFRDISLPHSVI